MSGTGERGPYPRGPRVARRLQAAKEGSGLTVRQIAERTSELGAPATSVTSVQRHLTGKVNRPNPELVRAMAEVMEVSFHWVWTGAGHPTEDQGDEHEVNRLRHSLRWREQELIQLRLEASRRYTGDGVVWFPDDLEAVQRASSLANQPRETSDLFLTVLFRLAQSEGPVKDALNEDGWGGAAQVLEEALLAPRKHLGIGPESAEAAAPAAYVAALLGALSGST